MRRLIGSSIVLMAIALTLAPEATNAAPSRSGFCNFWNAVCLRIGGRQDVCATRHTNCLSSGCFFFSNPRPRCENNAFDLDLMRPENRGKGCSDCRK
jgi:hypothetical protein